MIHTEKRPKPQPQIDRETIQAIKSHFTVSSQCNYGKLKKKIQKKDSSLVSQSISNTYHMFWIICNAR